jgi:hypothetical protein
VEVPPEFQLEMGLTRPQALELGEMQIRRVLSAVTGIAAAYGAAVLFLDFLDPPY